MKCPVCHKPIKKGNQIVCVTPGTVLQIMQKKALSNEEVDFSPNDKEYFYHDHCFWIQPK